MKLWRLWWMPEGNPIALVRATERSKAVRKAPAPYREFLGEILAEEVPPGSPLRPKTI